MLEPREPRQPSVHSAARGHRIALTETTHAYRMPSVTWAGDVMKIHVVVKGRQGIIAALKLKKQMKQAGRWLPVMLWQVNWQAAIWQESAVTNRDKNQPGHPCQHFSNPQRGAINWQILPFRARDVGATLPLAIYTAVKRCPRDSGKCA